MRIIKRNISTMQRFFEIVASMPNPECDFMETNKKMSGYAKNKYGVCLYKYIPTKEELPTFEKQIKKYIFKR